MIEESVGNQEGVCKLIGYTKLEFRSGTKKKWGTEAAGKIGR